MATEVPGYGGTVEELALHLERNGFGISANALRHHERQLAAYSQLVAAARALDAVLSLGWFNDGSAGLIPQHEALKAALEAVEIEELAQ